MSNGANLSIMGLYNFDQTILDMMVFPDGFSEEQKRITKQNILVECAELEFLYPNPIVAKPIIGIWSAKEKPYWQRVFNAANLEYNPIENYRRNETEKIEDDKTEQHSGTDTIHKTGNDTASASGSDVNSGSSSSTDTHSGKDSVENSVTGFDSNALVVHDKSETTYGHKIVNSASGTNTQTYGRKDTVTHNTTDTETHGEKIKHDGSSSRNVLAYGNIGVTTSQEMLTQEMEIAKIINVIPIIIESFKNRFCIMVY